MTTSQHSQLNLDSLTSLLEDSPVKTYQLQVYRKASQKKPDQVYFTNSSESYAWYDQNSLSWRTWQRSLIEGWTSFSGNFTKQGMMQNGQLYQQVLWEPVIREADGGSLPTPRANQAMAANLNLPSIKNHQYPNLETVVSQLPTPTASDVEGGVATDVQYKNGNYFRVNNKGERWGVKLRDAVAILPTPTARDYKDSGENMNYKKAAKKGRLPGVIVESRSTQTGKDTNLNPHFVEEMMGYPIGWTDLKH